MFTHLKEALEAQPNRKTGPACRVSTILTEANAEDRALLEAALADSTYRHTTIARALQADGYDITAWTVGNHRRRDCACARIAAKAVSA